MQKPEQRLDDAKPADGYPCFVNFPVGDADSAGAKGCVTLRFQVADQQCRYRDAPPWGQVLLLEVQQVV